LNCGIHVVAAGKQFHHSSVLLDLDLILVCGHANQCCQVGGDKTARPPAAKRPCRFMLYFAKSGGFPQTHSAIHAGIGGAVFQGWYGRLPAQNTAARNGDAAFSTGMTSAIPGCIRS